MKPQELTAADLIRAARVCLGDPPHDCKNCPLWVPRCCSAGYILDCRDNMVLALADLAEKGNQADGTK